MDNARRVSQVWNWLPAFRAVAETLHLPTASRDVGLSPSALSRAVKLLEDHLGQTLFVRDGRNLTLSSSGKALLDSVRDSMRRVDDGLDAIAATQMVGEIRISAAGPYASIFVLPAVQRLTRDHPLLVPVVQSVEPSQIYAKLLNGTLDIALLDDPVPEETLTVHLLGKLTSGLYCSPKHPLARNRHVSVQDALAHPYVGPPPGVTDHFPPHLERRLALVVTQLHIAVQACATGQLLAFLPDAIADGYSGEGSLVRLPIVLTSARALYAVHRRILSSPSRSQIVRQALEDAVRKASRMSRSGSVQPPDEGPAEEWS